ncbi:hypothetical protein GB864_09160 [Agromyces sp. MMS17-SY077]|uniref:Uncharacterized protein n=1 Tax=Agromyces seonyuensis TaxID=2662446 RepID=A0A6I4NWP8_9MICO|nr:hypothetical protein [Agromyces seonyuensis]
MHESASLSDDGEARSVADVVERLATKYPEVDRAEVERIVRTEHHEFDGKPVRDFVPVLVEKAAKKQIKAIAKA